MARISDHIEALLKQMMDQNNGSIEITRNSFGGQGQLRAVADHLCPGHPLHQRPGLPGRKPARRRRLDPDPPRRDGDADPLPDACAEQRSATPCRSIRRKS